MTIKEFIKLQIGIFITDNQDINEPSNYCKVLEFHNGKIRLQPYESYDKPANAHPFWEDFRDITVTTKLYASEYYSLCHRFA